MGNAELVAMMLADGRLPAGGHTQSGGLEPAVRAGLGADGKELADVAAYARDRLRTVTRVEAATAVVTRHLALHSRAPTALATTIPDSSSRGEWFAPVSPSRGSRLENPPADDLDPRLDEREAEQAWGESWVGVVEGGWAARVPSQVLRGVSRRQGRLLLRLAQRVWPEVAAYLPADCEIARPVVLGVVGAVTGLSAEQVARIVAYDDAQTVIAASLKLLPVDPADAATWLADLHDDIERLVKDVAPLTHVDQIPADGAPLIDVFAHQHAIERMRLFHA
ncbi:MAG TPA: urease accessory UreF family protein [Kribbella sp.]